MKNKIVEVVKVSFFLDVPQHPIMHLPTKWQIELTDIEHDPRRHGQQQVEIKFLGHNELQLGEGKVMGWVDSAGKNLAVCFSGGDSDSGLIVKLYTNEPRKQ